MRKEILVAGRGGQGILLLGHVIGLSAAKYAGLYVTGTESYSAETRGGDSKVDLIIADRAEELDYIKVRQANIAIFMYPTQLSKYSSLVDKGAKVFVDSTYVKEIPKVEWEVFSAPYTEMAEKKLGTHRVANMVALGHVIYVTKLMEPEAIINGMKEVVRKKWLDIDIKAFREGLSLGD